MRPEVLRFRAAARKYLKVSFTVSPAVSWATLTFQVHVESTARKPGITASVSGFVFIDQFQRTHNTQCWPPMQEIYRIEAIFPVQIHQMPEVPTDQRTDSGERAGGNMEGIIMKFWRDDFVCKVGARQRHGIGIQLDQLGEGCRKQPPDRFWSVGDFRGCYLGRAQREHPVLSKLPKSASSCGEFGVEIPANH